MTTGRINQVVGCRNSVQSLAPVGVRCIQRHVWPNRTVYFSPAGRHSRTGLHISMSLYEGPNNQTDGELAANRKRPSARTHARSDNCFSQPDTRVDRDRLYKT